MEPKTIVAIVLVSQACRYALPVREMLGELQEQPELHRKAA